MKSFCQHLPRHHGSVFRADSDDRWIKHCYSSKHVTPIKLWVVEIVSLCCPRRHSCSFNPLFLCASPRSLGLHTSCFASCIVCILAGQISETSLSTESYVDFFLFFPSAKSNSWCRWNVFFISCLQQKSRGCERSFLAADIIDNWRQRASWV